MVHFINFIFMCVWTSIFSLFIWTLLEIGGDYFQSKYLGKENHISTPSPTPISTDVPIDTYTSTNVPITIHHESTNIINTISPMDNVPLGQTLFVIFSIGIVVIWYYYFKVGPNIQITEQLDGGTAVENYLPNLVSPLDSITAMLNNIVFYTDLQSLTTVLNTNYLNSLLSSNNFDIFSQTLTLLASKGVCLSSSSHALLTQAFYNFEITNHITSGNRIELFLLLSQISELI